MALRNYSYVTVASEFGDIFIDSRRLFNTLYSEIVTRDLYGLNWVKLPPNITLLDFGANVGLFTKIFKSRFSVKDSICFEPFPFTFSILEKNLGGESRLYNFGVGAKSGRYVSHTGADSGLTVIGDYSSVLYRGAKDTECLIKSLEGVKEFFPAKEPYFLKVDVEGAEDVFFFTDLGRSLIDNSVYSVFELHFFQPEKPTRADYHNILKLMFSGRFTITSRSKSQWNVVIGGQKCTQ